MTTVRPSQRIPLNTLAIPLGLAGLADIWADTSGALGLPRAIPFVFLVIAIVGWLWMIAAHVWRGIRSRVSLRTQLVHPAQGPLASLVPIVGIAIAGELVDYWRIGAIVLAVVSITAAALYAGWLVSSWTTGRLQIESFHGGYFLPTVAAGYITSFTAAQIGSVPLAIGAFAVATFFWIALFALLIARVAFRPALPDPLLPTLAIMMAPPAVAARAWFAIHGLAANPVQDALAAVAVIMVLMEIGLLRRYLALSFSLGFWSFTFPTIAVADLAAAWAVIEHPVGWQILVAVLVLGSTVLVAAIGYKSLRLRVAGTLTVARAETQLRLADDAIAVRSR